MEKGDGFYLGPMDAQKSEETLSLEHTFRLDMQTCTRFPRERRRQKKISRGGTERKLST